jgi:hypothetical protein
MRGALSRAGEVLVAHPLATLFLLWLTQSLYLAALQWSGLPYGYAVWPMGEDRNWLRFMLDAPGPGMMHEFWGMNDRNPLSPWWYWALSRPILHWDSALYVTRRLVDPLLASSVVLLLGRLVPRRNPLPLAAGVLVLAFNFSDYREQITWNFLVALALALLSVYLYVVYVDSRRTRGPMFGASLLLFLVAIATYTLELGVLLALAAVALFRVPASARSTTPLRRRLAEVAVFLAFAAVFLMIWYTLARSSSTYYRLDPALAARQALASMRQLLWHDDLTYWVAAARRSPGTLAVAAPIALLHAAVIFAVVTNTAGRHTGGRSLAWIVVVLLAVAAPIVALESMSDTWLPGYRSRMVYEVTSPLLCIMVAGLVSSVVARFSRPASAFVLATILAVAASLVVVAAFDYNRQLVVKTEDQRRLARQLPAVLDAYPSKRVLLVRFATDPRKVWSSDSLTETYARTILRRQDVSMRFLQHAPVGDPQWAWWWRVRLGDDATGVGNARVGVVQPEPYANVLFLDYDGARLTVPGRIDESWFAGQQADWQRAAPILQNATDEFPCPAEFRFSDLPPDGTGWSAPERQADGTYRMWMASTHASMRVATSCAGDVQVTLRVVGYMGEDIVNGLHLRVDGQPVPLAARRRDDRLDLVGSFREPPGSKRVRFELEAPRTVVPPGGTRTLAVMFSAVVVKTAGAGDP